LQDNEGNTLYSECPYDAWDPNNDDGLSSSICGLQPGCYNFIASESPSENMNLARPWELLDADGTVLQSGDGGDTVEVCLSDTLAPTHSPPTPLPTVSASPTAEGTRTVSTYSELKDALLRENIDLEAPTCYLIFYNTTVYLQFEPNGDLCDYDQPGYGERCVGPTATLVTKQTKVCPQSIDIVADIDFPSYGEIDMGFNEDHGFGSSPFVDVGPHPYTIMSSVGATLSGSWDSRFFYIEQSSDVTFTGLTFASGSALTGGCMYIEHSRVWLEDVNFIDCRVTDKGAAIMLRRDLGQSSPETSLDMVSTTFSSSTVDIGVASGDNWKGAISTYGVLTMTASMLSLYDNHPYDIIQDYGGVAYCNTTCSAGQFANCTYNATGANPFHPCSANCGECEDCPGTNSQLYSRPPMKRILITPSHFATNPSTHQPTNSPTHRPTNPRPHPPNTFTLTSRQVNKRRVGLKFSSGV
jgi:hypothetical protein